MCTTSSSQPQYYPNYVVCDVAEMYLICAESNLEAGQTVPATSYVNVLERRAGAREYSSITKDDIFNVYTKEFMNEGVNFWASLRLKGLDWTAKQKVETENGTYKNGDFIAISEENIVKKQGLMQIPLSAITKYGLDQNPGW